MCSCPAFGVTHAHHMCLDSVWSHFSVIVHCSNLVINTTNKSTSTCKCSLLLFCQWNIAGQPAAGVQRKQQMFFQPKWSNTDYPPTGTAWLWWADRFIHQFACGSDYTRWLRRFIICEPYDTCLLQTQFTHGEPRHLKYAFCHTTNITLQSTWGATRLFRTTANFQHA